MRNFRIIDGPFSEADIRDFNLSEEEKNRPIGRAIEENNHGGRGLFHAYKTERQKSAPSPQETQNKPGLKKQ